MEWDMQDLALPFKIPPSTPSKVQIWSNNTSSQPAAKVHDSLETGQNNELGNGPMILVADKELHCAKRKEKSIPSGEEMEPCELENSNNHHKPLRDTIYKSGVLKSLAMQPPDKTWQSGGPSENNASYTSSGSQDDYAKPNVKRHCSSTVVSRQEHDVNDEHNVLEQPLNLCIHPHNFERLSKAFASSLAALPDKHSSKKPSEACSDLSDDFQPEQSGALDLSKKSFSSNKLSEKPKSSDLVSPGAVQDNEDIVKSGEEILNKDQEVNKLVYDMESPDKGKHVDLSFSSNPVEGLEDSGISLTPATTGSTKKKKKFKDFSHLKSLQRNKILNFAQKETDSTKRVTDWSVGIFQRWMNQDSERSQLPRLLHMTVPQINTYLCKFLVDARKSDGTRYPSKSLQALGQGLLRYVRNNRVYTKKECGSTDGIFRPVNQVLSMELRRTMHYEAIEGRTPKVRQKKKPSAVEDKYVFSGFSGQAIISENGAPVEPSIKQKETFVADWVASCSVPQQFEDAEPLGAGLLESENGSVQHNIVDENVVETNPATKKPSEAEDKMFLRSHSSGSTEETHGSKSTEKNTRWAVHLFNKWRLTRQEDGKSPIPEIQEMTVDDVNNYLADFISTVVKTDGGDYIPSCLYSLACGLLRHSRNHSRHDLEFMNSKDHRFAEFHAALNSRIKSLELESAMDRPKMLPFRHFSSLEEKRLWDYHFFGMETGKSLQYTVFYHNLKLFDIKSFAHHRSLQRHQFSITSVDDTSEKMLYFDGLLGDPEDKDKDKPKGRQLQEYRNQPGEEDLVGHYEVYLEAIGSSGPFYKRLVGLNGRTSRFSEQNIGIRSLQNMWGDICEAVRLE